MDELIEKYLNKIGIEATQEFTQEEANVIANANVMSYYKNRIYLKVDKTYTAVEIAEKLALIEFEFRKRFDENSKEIFSGN